MRHSSVGVIRYSRPDGEFKVHVDVDPEIARYARYLTPTKLQIPRYPTHISVVRKETPPDLRLWGLHEGCEIRFEYDNHVYEDGKYYWLRAWSDELIALREGLGLPSLSWAARPPDNEDCFHITIGNLKGLK